MKYTQNGEYLDLRERERIAWANGDTTQAALLAKCADEGDELNRLRAMYWALRECFPIRSSDTEAAILAQVKAAWEVIEDAGEIGHPE